MRFQIARVYLFPEKEIVRPRIAYVTAPRYVWSTLEAHLTFDTFDSYRS